MSRSGEAVALLPPATPMVAAPRDAVVHTLSGQSMGSTWRLRLAAAPLALDEVRERVEACLAMLVRQMSHWEPASDLSCFNRRPAGTWQALAPDFASVMRSALLLAERSAGAFDPALGGAIESWGFGATGRFDSPGFTGPGPAVDGGETRTWRALQLDGDRLLQSGGCRLDLSAIAKGHAVDAVAAVLRRQGWHHFLFELGGELRGEGLKPDGQPWWVGLERPPDAVDLPALRVALIGQAVATSGDYRQGFRDGGGRWCSHTLDPRTGRPVNHALASVSVLHGRCAWADALATALFVMGPHKGPRWAAEHQVAAWFVARDEAGGWREWPSPAMAAWRDG